MTKLIEQINGLYKEVQAHIDTKEAGKIVTNELRSAAVKLGSSARHLERHLLLIAQIAASKPAPAAPAPAAPATPATAPAPATPAS